jgi:UDPglucose 6-dehydrogenase
MAEVCGGDVVTLADAIGHDTRIGRRFLSGGIGFGGGCLPKDIRAFMARAGELGVGEALSFLKAVDEVNMRRRQRTPGRSSRRSTTRWTSRRRASGPTSSSTSPSGRSTASSTPSA